MIRSFRGKSHRNIGISEYPNHFYISSSVYGPLRVYPDIKSYEKEFKEYKTDYAVIPDEAVCIYMDLDCKTSNNVETEVFTLLDNTKEKLNTIKEGIKIRWVGTSHSTNKQNAINT